MNLDHLLRNTLIASLCIHGLIILPRVNFNPFTPAPKKQEIKVRYVKEDVQIKLQRKSADKSDAQGILEKSEPFLKLDSKIIAGKRAAPPPYLEKSNSSDATKALTNKTAGFRKPTFAAPEVMAIKKRISLPAIEMAKIDNPSYINYYQIVREKIRRSAYQNYTHSQTGEVYISFIISCDGSIKDVRLIEDKTTAADYLKTIALRSVRDAAPFPNFPKELDYLQLSFNIIISFEIE
ncbi:MAG: hypothetical protein WC543_04465 [Candidatus Omnitrophota bacterium]